MNSNCLEGIKCPACGNEDAFRIRCTTLATVEDDGVMEHGDMEWDDSSYIHCVECLASGMVGKFTTV